MVGLIFSCCNLVGRGKIVYSYNVVNCCGGIGWFGRCLYVWDDVFYVVIFVYLLE